MENSCQRIEHIFFEIFAFSTKYLVKGTQFIFSFILHPSIFLPLFLNLSLTAAICFVQSFRPVQQLNKYGTSSSCFIGENIVRKLIIFLVMEGGKKKKGLGDLTCMIEHAWTTRKAW